MKEEFGEHGDFLVPIFSNASVDGNSLLSLINDDEKKSMTSDIRNYWRELRNYKSRSQFGIAKNTFDVIDAIVNDKEISISASVVLEGEYGENDVAMGTPVKINQNGVTEIQKIKLDESELSMLKESAKKIRDDISSV